MTAISLLFIDHFALSVDDRASEFFILDTTPLLLNSGLRSDPHAESQNRSMSASSHLCFGDNTEVIFEYCSNNKSKSLMCLAVTSDKAGSVYCKDNRKILKPHIMIQLVISSLQKRRIYCKHRFNSPAANPAAKVTACSSAIPTSKKAFREHPLEPGEPCSILHRGCNGNNIFCVS